MHPLHGVTLLHIKKQFIGKFNLKMGHEYSDEYLSIMFVKIRKLREIEVKHYKDYGYTVLKKIQEHTL